MEYLVFIGCIVAVFFIAKILSWPFKLIWKLIVNIVLGGILLYVVNIVGSLVGISIAFNWITALIAGLLGVPGVILLIIFSVIF